MALADSLPLSRGSAYDAMVGRKMQVNNFMGKSGALGSFLTDTNKATLEANRTEARTKLSKEDNSGMWLGIIQSKKGNGGIIILMKQEEHLLGVFL